MSIKRRWIIYAEYDNGLEQLNELPFIGDIADVVKEAERLIIDPDAVEGIEFESLGIVSSAGGMEER